MNKLLQKFLLIILFIIPSISFAHFPNQSYIFLNVYETQGIEGRFEINTRELNKIFDLNLRDNVTLEDLLPYEEKIKAYFLRHAAFSSKNGTHRIVLEDKALGVFPISQGAMIQVYFKLDNLDPLPQSFEVMFDAVYEKDKNHSGYLVIENNWGAGVINSEANIALSFDPDNTVGTLNLNETSIWKGFVAMIKQGVWHIWIGLDHILFLLALILPSVVRRIITKNPDSGGISESKGIKIFGKTVGNWTPVENFKDAFIYVVKIITFFTIAHSITLSLASLEIVNLPSRFVESVIALSIGLAAYHNIFPIFRGKDWIIAFIFGLFHGFGFASVLGDLGLSNENLTATLLGFNIGVEIGQLVIIIIIFPVLFLLRKSKFYKKLLVFGSIFLILISLYWAIERIFDINLGADYFLSRVYNGILKFLGLR